MWKFCALPFTPANICWSWWRFQHVFRVKILRLPRRHKDVLRLAKTSLKTSCKIHEDVFKTSWKTKNCYAEDMSWRRLEDMSWRRLEDIMEKSKILFNICLILELKQHLYSRIKISDDVWCCEISWIKIRHCKKGEAIKTNF